MQSQSVGDIRKSAEEAFASGLYCAESVVLSLARAQGIESDLLTRMATGFRGGMARSCGTCGALTGAIMGLGISLGRSQPGDSVKDAYSATQRLIREFEQA